MSKWKIIVLGIACFLAGLVLAWLVRGLYDAHFMMDGHFHVISQAERDYNVTLEFPSGKEISFLLNKYSAVDFMLTGTGEGSIIVKLDGNIRDRVGYVTSMNSLVILTIGDKHTGFSQVFPSLVTENINDNIERGERK